MTQFCDHLVYFHRFGMFTENNLATLMRNVSVDGSILCMIELRPIKKKKKSEKKISLKVENGIL
jgi:hypothetical protein